MANPAVAEERAKRLKAGEEKVEAMLKLLSHLDALILLKMIRILMPHQSTQLHQLEPDILAELRRPESRMLIQ